MRIINLNQLYYSTIVKISSLTSKSKYGKDISSCKYKNVFCFKDFCIYILLSQRL